MSLPLSLLITSHLTVQSSRESSGKMGNPKVVTSFEDFIDEIIKTHTLNRLENGEKGIL